MSKNSWCIHWPFTLLRCSQSWSNADVYLVFVHCCDNPNLTTKLTHTPSFYVAELFLILKPCWSLQSLYIAGLFPLLKHCWQYSVISCCWAVPHLITLLTYTLSWYIAGLLAILKQSWCGTCLLTLLICSQTCNVADVYPVRLHCWAVTHLMTLLTYTLSCYNADAFPIPTICWCVPCPLIGLKGSQSYNIADNTLSN